jgi:hypothetical protein
MQFGILGIKQFPTHRWREKILRLAESLFSFWEMTINSVVVYHGHALMNYIEKFRNHVFSNSKYESMSSQNKNAIL